MTLFTPHSPFESTLGESLEHFNGFLANLHSVVTITEHLVYRRNGVIFKCFDGADDCNSHRSGQPNGLSMYREESTTHDYRSHWDSTARRV